MGLIMYFISPWACRVFFGNNWYIAGIYIKILVPYYVFRFIGTSVSNGLVISNKQDKELWIQISLVLTSIVALVITKYFNKDVIYFLKMITLLKSLVYISLICIIWIDSEGKKGCKKVI